MNRRRAGEPPPGNSLWWWFLAYKPADPMYVHRGWRGAPPLRTLHGDTARRRAGSDPPSKRLSPGHSVGADDRRRASPASGSADSLLRASRKGGPAFSTRTSCAAPLSRRTGTPRPRGRVCGKVEVRHRRTIARGGAARQRRRLDAGEHVEDALADDAVDDRRESPGGGTRGGLAVRRKPTGVRRRRVLTLPGRNNPAGSDPRGGCDAGTPIAPRNQRFRVGRSRHYTRRNTGLLLWQGSAIGPATTGSPMRGRRGNVVILAVIRVHRPNHGLPRHNRKTAAGVNDAVAEFGLGLPRDPPWTGAARTLGDGGSALRVLSRRSGGAGGTMSVQREFSPTHVGLHHQAKRSPFGPTESVARESSSSGGDDHSSRLRPIPPMAPPAAPPHSGPQQPDTPPVRSVQSA